MNVSREPRAVFALAIAASLLAALPIVPSPVAADGGREAGRPPTRIDVDLEELWRRGGPDDELIFGRIAAAAIDSSGNLYLLDARLKKVHAFDPEGRHLGVPAVEGDGPGEIRHPVGMAMLPGGALAVAEAMPGRLVRIDAASGDPLPSIELEAPGGGLAMATGLRAAGPHIAACGFVSGAGESRNFLSRFAPDGRESALLLAKDHPRRRTGKVDLGAGYFVEAGRWDMGPDGSIYAAPERDRYRIEVFRPDGGRETWRRKFESRRRDADEKERLVSGSREAARAMGLEFVPRDTPPCIKEIAALPCGLVLVRHNRSETDLPDGAMRRCDLYDGRGKLLAEVSLRLPEGDGVLDRLFFPGPGVAVLVRGGDPFPCRPGLRDEEPWPMETIVCRVRWPDPAGARPEPWSDPGGGRRGP